MTSRTRNSGAASRRKPLKPYRRIHPPSRLAEWFRLYPLRPADQGNANEVWISQDAGGESARRYDVQVRTGKKTDLLSFKHVDQFSADACRTRTTRTAMFAQGDLERVEACPVCGKSADDAAHRLTIHGGHYHQCSGCGHCFVMNRPTPTAMNAFYANNEDYAATYTDPATLETRVRLVNAPKADWVMETFERLYGRPPRAILDVGAGAGHFVHACRQMGIRAEGIEVSQASRRFCSERFGFELQDADLARDWQRFTEFEVVTFWGVIEHVPSPLSLLAAARNILGTQDGLVVAEVPRWESLSTAIQSALPDTVVRHLDPMSHIHCFTDSSLATAFESCGLAPAAAWYLGMDALEWTTQLSHQLGDERLLKILAPHLTMLQEHIDQGGASDEVILAGRPI